MYDFELNPGSAAGYSAVAAIPALAVEVFPPELFGSASVSRPSFVLSAHPARSISKTSTALNRMEDLRDHDPYY
jgi:hypothetical protein